MVSWLCEISQKPKHSDNFNLNTILYFPFFPVLLPHFTLFSQFLLFTRSLFHCPRIWKFDWSLTLTHQWDKNNVGRRLGTKRLLILSPSSRYFIVYCYCRLTVTILLVSLANLPRAVSSLSLAISGRILISNIFSISIFLHHRIMFCSQLLNAKQFE